MFAGVFVYSFLIGSFTSLFTSLDHSTENIKLKRNILNKLRNEFKLTAETYNKARNFIKSGNEKPVENYQEFLTDLPEKLFIEVSYMIYKKELDEIEYFNVCYFSLVMSQKRPENKQNKSHSFITMIGARLKPLHVSAGEFIYNEGDPAEESKKPYICFRHV
jgi:hypothetical protein